MNEKSYVSVICEYNPFHHGHLYQLQKLKEAFDGVVCIMSGNLVQRGSAAIADKYIRAEAALRSGANLVLELPVPWCCASARDFAAAGVYIADAIGSRSLAFGTEDDLHLLLQIDSLVSNADFADKLQKRVEADKNISYPHAFRTAVSEHFGEEYAEIIGKPNNILALEYLGAMRGKEILPYAVKRDLSLKSSSVIRSAEDGEAMMNMLPESSRNVFSKALNSDFPRNNSKLDSFFIGTLRRMGQKNSIPQDIYSTPDDLAKKIISESLRVSAVTDLIHNCTDKKYTSARVRRAVLSAVFGITTQQVRRMPPYTCVLASDSIGREILRTAKNQSDIDIITKPAHALVAGKAVKEAFLFAKGIEDIVALSAPEPQPADKGKTPLII